MKNKQIIVNVDEDFHKLMKMWSKKTMEPMSHLVRLSIAKELNRCGFKWDPSQK